MTSLRLLFYAGLVIQPVGFVILTAFAVRSYLQGRRNRLPGSPWLGPLFVAFGILFSMLRRLYVGMLEVIPITTAAPVLVIAGLFVLAGLTLMFRDWRKARERIDGKRATAEEGKR